MHSCERVPIKDEGKAGESLLFLMPNIYQTYTKHIPNIYQTYTKHIPSKSYRKDIQAKQKIQLIKVGFFIDIALLNQTRHCGLEPQSLILGDTEQILPQEHSGKTKNPTR